jgi:hypothetical protein
MYTCLHIKYLLFLSDGNKNLYFLNRFSKNTQTSNSMKICPVGAELFHAEGRTDRRKDMKKSIVTLRNLRNEMGMTLQHLGESQQIRCG